MLTLKTGKQFKVNISRKINEKLISFTYCFYNYKWKINNYNDIKF